MGLRDEINIGYLSRRRHGQNAYAIGFGTNRGTVAASSNWDEPMQRMQVRPAHPDSYERICHQSGRPAFLLPLREPAVVREGLLEPHLERAIGVVYRPDTELLSHYFQAALAAQFDEYVWFDETSAVEPLPTGTGPGVPETYPFGL
jgi:protein-L-isoaspartate(D-aspartate) O-methyltransferase